MTDRMRLGMHLRELWAHKVGLALALALATLVAVRTLYGIELFPPGLERNPIQLASASTEVIVDTPRSAVTDLREDTYSFAELTNRALLLGNVLASLPVRTYIARRSKLAPEEIQVSAPLTPEQPRAVASSAYQPKTSDILDSPDEYRLSIHANPTVPVLNIYSEAPDGKSAARLANAAVDGLGDYLRALAREHGTPGDEQVRLNQLGRASGGVVNPGAGLQLAVLAFTVIFAGSCALVLFVARVRRGWVSTAGFEGQPGRGVG